MPASLKELFMIDKLMKIKEIVKRVGGIGPAIKQRYLIDDNRDGKFIGEDQFGNKYYQDDRYYVPRNRYVIYSEKVWLDYDASQVPPEWHRWLHHICDDPPTITKPVRHKWQLDHKENMSAIDVSQKYVP